MNLLVTHTFPLPLALLLGLAAGLLLGAAHFATLVHNLRLLQGGRAALGLAVLALRLLATAVLLGLLICFGVGAVVGGMAGLLLARQATLHRLARVPLRRDQRRDAR